MREVIVNNGSSQQTTEVLFCGENILTLDQLSPSHRGEESYAIHV